MKLNNSKTKLTNIDKVNNENLSTSIKVKVFVSIINFSQRKPCASMISLTIAAKILKNK